MKKLIFVQNFTRHEDNFGWYSRHKSQGMKVFCFTHIKSIDAISQNTPLANIYAIVAFVEMLFP